MDIFDAVALAIVFQPSQSSDSSGSKAPFAKVPKKPEEPPKGSVVAGLVLGAALVGLVGYAGGCGQQPLPTINNYNSNTNTNNNGGGLTNPDAVAGQCLASEETPIRVDLNVPVTVPNGQTAPIDATPKSSAGKRSDGCNVLQGIYWTTSPTTTCFVPQPSEFNTVMKCSVAGPCQITATVPGKGASGTATVSCQ